MFPATRQAVLAATLMHPDRWWYLSDLAKHLGLSPSTLQRELAGLVEAGILRRRRDGNRVYFQANPDCPVLPELRRLMVKTVGLADVLREALQPLAAGIRVAMIYGSVARAEEQSGSDVDLLVVGDVGLSDLAPALKEAEKRLQRPINPMVYSAEEFARKARSGHHLITNVVKGEMIFLLGGRHELESLARGPAASHARRPKERA